MKLVMKIAALFIFIPHLYHKVPLFIVIHIYSMWTPKVWISSPNTRGMNIDLFHLCCSNIWHSSGKDFHSIFQHHCEDLFGELMFSGSSRKAFAVVQGFIHFGLLTIYPSCSFSAVDWFSNILLQWCRKLGIGCTRFNLLWIFWSPHRVKMTHTVFRYIPTALLIFVYMSFHKLHLDQTSSDRIFDHSSWQNWFI